MTYVVMPYTRISVETVDALKATARPFHRHKVGDDDRYWRLLSGLWAKGGDFAIVEHDIIVNPDTFDTFDDCSSEWCVAPYPFDHRLCSGLGCVRFRGPLLLKFPEILKEVSKRTHPFYPGRRNWRTLDACIRDLLRERGVVRCQHAPVGHGGEHGCDCVGHPYEVDGVVDNSWLFVENKPGGGNFTRRPPPDRSGRYRGKT
jgi:hypothetical protein